MLLLSTGEFDPLRSYSLLDPECSTFLYWTYYVYIPVPLIVLSPGVEYVEVAGVDF